MEWDWLCQDCRNHYFLHYHLADPMAHDHLKHHPKNVEERVLVPLVHESWLIKCYGKLHLGGLRTALYNFLYARSRNGKFILRIEDTDRTRLVPGAVEQLERDLMWVGLAPDEGPSPGGTFGPYVQSERFEIYKEFANKLILTGAAYHCFCSEKRLDLLRKDAVRNRLVPKYDNHCRHLSRNEVLEKIKAGLPSCIRFKLVSSTSFDDLVFGTTLHEVEEIEGDPVILKADSWPTYHLANVVDDSLMNISHVIRGVEWLPSTNKHIMIYNALGLKPPVFAHLPLLLNTDGTKLSKRQNDITVESMREKGIFPRALLNYVIQAGGGFPKSMNQNSSLKDLISNFDLTAVSKSSGKLPTERLHEFNRLEIARRVRDEKELIYLIDCVKELVCNKFTNKHSLDELDLSDDHIKTVLLWSLPRITCLQDLIDKNLEFLWVIPRQKDLKENSPGILDDIGNELSFAEFNKSSLVKTLRNYCDKTNVPFKDLMKLLRIALSGLKQGPGVAEMLEILGKSTSLKRIERARNLCSKS